MVTSLTASLGAAPFECDPDLYSATVVTKLSCSQQSAQGLCQQCQLWLYFTVCCGMSLAWGSPMAVGLLGSSQSHVQQGSCWVRACAELACAGSCSTAVACNSAVGYRAVLSRQLSKQQKGCWETHQLASHGLQPR
jgi:hypothetical protein